MQATMLAFRANARYGVPNTEGRATQPSGLPDGLRGTLSQAAAVCMVSERALRTRWNKRQADRRAYEAGLLRNESDSLLSAVRGRLLMIVTDEGFRAAAMLAHRAAAVDQRGRQVGQRGQWHQVRQPPGRDGQEHRGARLYRPHPGAGRRDHDQ